MYSKMKMNLKIGMSDLKQGISNNEEVEVALSNKEFEKYLAF